MNVVDSSAWLEYLASGPNASAFAPAIEHSDTLIVPSICVYEVYKLLRRRGDKNVALQAVALMSQGRIVELNRTLALNAAETSIELGLPMADSIILATARTHRATLWTQDADFEGLEGVEFRAHGG